MKLMRALVLVALSLAAAGAFAQDKVSLRLNWYLGGLHVPFYYGKERGFYAAEGIDLTINEGRGRRTPCRSSPPAPTRSAWPIRRR